MQVPELLHPLLLTVNVEVVIARLPERTFVPPHGHRQLQRLYRPRQETIARFAHQKMHVFRHHHITRYDEVMPLPHSFQRRLEQVAGVRRRQKRQPTITTEGQKMKVSGLLVSNQSTGHCGKDTPQGQDGSASVLSRVSKSSVKCKDILYSLSPEMLYTLGVR